MVGFCSFGLGIALLEPEPSIQRRQLLLGFLQSLLIQIPDGYRATFFDQSLAGSHADAHCPAGDDCGLALQICLQFSPFFGLMETESAFIPIIQATFQPCQTGIRTADSAPDHVTSG